MRISGIRLSRPAGATRRAPNTVLRDVESDEDLESLDNEGGDPEDRGDLARLGLDEEELEDEDEDSEDEDDEGQEAAGSTDDDEESDETSLEDLLAKRAAARRGGEDSDEDVTEILGMSSEREPSTLDVDPPPGKVTPIRSDEFVCARCYLVKPRVQLADPERGLCRDCA
ncbi:MAG: DUF4193 family protein [Actinobacteria bacterium]|nr:DUF4193 family protein [Actinomycetota bacterium]